MPFLVRRVRVGGGRAELLVVAALLLIALAARLPYLWDIPRFTDETAEAEIALQIVRGESLPLASRDPYIGTLWNWVLAAGFTVSGPSLFTPRLLIAVLGALTVVPAYLLGKSLCTPRPPAPGHSAARERGGELPPPHRTGEGWGRGLLAGALAGLLLALSPAWPTITGRRSGSGAPTPRCSR
jgi:hypothetical protein